MHKTAQTFYWLLSSEIHRVFGIVLHINTQNAMRSNRSLE